jgi:hypothetical protein
MARGWESKAVEAQQEEALRGASLPAQPSADQLARREKRRALELTRKRVAGDLARAAAPAHRAMLEQALESLDAQILELSD